MVKNEFIAAIKDTEACADVSKKDIEAVIKGMSEVRFTMRNALEELVDNSLMALRDVEFTDSNGNLVDWKNLEVR